MPRALLGRILAQSQGKGKPGLALVFQQLCQTLFFRVLRSWPAVSAARGCADRTQPAEADKGKGRGCGKP